MLHVGYEELFSQKSCWTPTSLIQTTTSWCNSLEKSITLSKEAVIARELSDSPFLGVRKKVIYQNALCQRPSCTFVKFATLSSQHTQRNQNLTGLPVPTQLWRFPKGMCEEKKEIPCIREQLYSLT